MVSVLQFECVKCGATEMVNLKVCESWGCWCIATSGEEESWGCKPPAVAVGLMVTQSLANGDSPMDLGCWCIATPGEGAL